MKKWLLLIPLIALTFLFKAPFTLQAAVSEEATLIENQMSDLVSLYPTSHGQIECYANQIKYWYDGSEVTIDGSYITHFEDGEYLYLIVKNEVTKLSKYKKSILQKEAELTENLTLKQILLHNDYLYLIGYTPDAGLIMTYSQDLKEIKQYQYGVDSGLKIYQALIIQNEWYLACSKNAHGAEPFLNVGNDGEEKTCLVKLNNKMQLSEIKYFNHHQKEELPYSLTMVGSVLGLIIKSGDTYYYYQIDNLLNPKYVDSYTGVDDTLIGYDGTFLKVNKTSGFSLSSAKDTYLDKPWNQVVYYDIKDGYFNVYVVLDGNLYKYQFDEYHINQLDEFHVDFSHSNLDFEHNLNGQGVVDVSSIVGAVEVYAEGGVNLNIPGVFDVNILIKRSNKDNIKLSTMVRINQYVNVINKGVYRTGMMLSFMGNATLNGNVVTSGYYINSPGNYTLTISDNKTQLQVIEFSVVDDYYSRIMPIIGGDYVLPAGSETYIDFTMPEVLTVEEVIMDQKETEFLLNNNILKIPMCSLNNYAIETHTINRVRIGEVWCDVDYSFSVKTLKKAPIFEVTEGETKNLTLNIKIDDPEQAIKYLLCKDLKTGKEYYNYIKNDTVTLDGLKGKSSSIEISIIYDLGDGVEKAKKLINLDANFKTNTLFSIIWGLAGEKVSEAHLKMDDKATRGMTNLVVCNENITSTYLDNNNATNLVISIAITAVVAIAIIVFLIIKRSKRSKI